MARYIIHVANCKCTYGLVSSDGLTRTWHYHVPFVNYALILLLHQSKLDTMLLLATGLTQMMRANPSARQSGDIE